MAKVDFDKITNTNTLILLQAAQTLGLVISGVDILAKDIRKKATNNNCAIIEVNPDPDLRLHD